MKPALIYHAGYRMNLGGHVFCGVKYPLVYMKMKEEGLLDNFVTMEPRWVKAKELALVHSPEYIRDLLSADHTYRTYLSELPINEEIVRTFLLMCGGTVLAAQEAIKRGSAINLAGGFHHGYPAHAEGFCYINDVAVAVKTVLSEGLIEKASIIDLDIHQGNGTAYIFRGDERIFTFSMHQEDIYPSKERSDWDVGLRRGVTDEQYLKILEECLERMDKRLVGELAVIVSGADPLVSDALGHLLLTEEGLYERDRMMVRWAKKNDIGIAFTMGGGYSRNVEDTVRVHLGTAKAICSEIENIA